MKVLKDDSVCECEIENNDTTELKTTVEAEIVRDVNEVWGRGKGGYLSISRINKNALRDTIKDFKEKDTMYYTLDILAEHMSPNNFIKDTVNNSYLERMSNGYLTMPTLKRNKPLTKLIDLDLIAINDKKQCMVNPIIACAYIINKDNMNDLARMYNEFKATGRFTDLVYKGFVIPFD